MAVDLTFVVDETIPEGEAYLVPNPPPRPNETPAEYETRRMLGAVKLINIAEVNRVSEDVNRITGIPDIMRGAPHKGD